MKQYQAPAGATSISIEGESFDVDSDGVVSVPEHADHAHLLAHGYRQLGDVPVAVPANVDAAFNARVAEVKADFDARDARLSERHNELDQRAAELATLSAALDQRQADLDALAAALAAKPADDATAPPPPPGPMATTKPKR